MGVARGVHIIIKTVSALDRLTSGKRSECNILHVEMKNCCRAYSLMKPVYAQVL